MTTTTTTDPVRYRVQYETAHGYHEQSLDADEVSFSDGMATFHRNGDLVHAVAIEALYDVISAADSTSQRLPPSERLV